MRPARDMVAEEWKATIEQAEIHVRKGTLPLIGWRAEGPRILRLSADEAQGQWYFIGDLHGDHRAWETLFARVCSDPEFRLCFLGDVVDRGPYHVECLAALLQAAMDHPDRILWLLGNHDAAHRRNEDCSEGAPRYVSRVEPAEFVDWLNARTDDQGWSDRILDLLNTICHRLPRAALFSDGLLATHGGLPLADQWANITALEHFEDARVLEDFTWTRAVDAPRRRGWQYAPERRKRSSDFEFGWRDLQEFATVFSELFPVRRVVRGHDHVAGGWARPDAYQQAVPLLTLNGFGFDHLTNSMEQYREYLVLGVYKKDQLPRVEEVSVPQPVGAVCGGYEPSRPPAAHMGIQAGFATAVPMVAGDWVPHMPLWPMLIAAVAAAVGIIAAALAAATLMMAVVAAQ